MPTLEKRIDDGGFYIRHFFSDYRTWQVVGEGVRILAHRGITEGRRFSTDLFMNLLRRGLVYHGNNIPAGPPLAVDAANVTADLQQRIAEFCSLLQVGDLDKAWTIVATSFVPEIDDGESPERAFEHFVSEMRNLNLARWRRIDTNVADTDIEVMRENQTSWRATRRGRALVRLWLGNGSDAIERDAKQVWLYSGHQWWLWLPGI